jgi:hypothetical protein
MANGKEVIRQQPCVLLVPSRALKYRWVGLGVAVLLCLTLAACAGASTDSLPPVVTGTAPTGTGTASVTTSQPVTTPTPYDLGTPGAVLGTTDACAVQGPPSASLPSNIPVYANAQMTIGSIKGSNGVFGLCSSDSVTTIDTYYSAQLPARGWQKVTDAPLANARQLTAQQAQTNLIVTILPDSRQDGKTNILIIFSGIS